MRVPQSILGSLLGVCALAASSLVVAPATSAVGPGAPERTATVAILHAIPEGRGADVVDVYAGRTLIVDDLTPGTLKVLKLPGGTYDVGIYPDGRSPGAGTALLMLNDATVASGSNLTVAAHLNAAGRPAIRVFVNDTRTVGQGMGRLTVRHIAAAPPVDVRSAGRVLFANLTNPRQATAGLQAGSYPVDVVLAGTRKTVLGPTTITIKNRPGTFDMGTNTIAYAWGSLDDGTLALLVQEVRIDLR